MIQVGLNLAAKRIVAANGAGGKCQEEDGGQAAEQEQVLNLEHFRFLKIVKGLNTIQSQLVGQRRPTRQ